VGQRSEFLQIRVTPAEKAALRRLARQAGQGVSAFVLSRALPAPKLRFQALVRELAHAAARRSFVLAELNDLLSVLPAPAFEEAVAHADVEALSPADANYLAAMVEHAAHLKGAAPPPWARDIDAPDEPWFATDLRSLRPWLVSHSPAAFKRRNLFIDATVGDRV
jgi:uncharacterized protein (DUF1778 family)